MVCSFGFAMIGLAIVGVLLPSSCRKSFLRLRMLDMASQLGDSMTGVTTFSVVLPDSWCMCKEAAAVGSVWRSQSALRR